jgi:hypothetical protein
MKRLAVLGLVVLAMLAVTAVSTGVHRDLSHPNDFVLLSALGPFLVLMGGIAASVYLARRRDSARGVLGVGLYSLMSGTAFVTVFSRWLAEDDIIPDTAFVGALLAMVGTALAISSALTLRGRPTAMALTAGWLAGVVAFLAVGAGGINVPTPLVRPQFTVLLLVVATVGLLTRHQGQMLLQPLLLSAGGTILTILDLVMGGPGD